jgi:hypothetical protein
VNPRRIALFPALLAIFLLAACGQSPTGEGQPSAAPELQGEIVASEIVLGSDRLPLGILDHNTPVNDAIVHVRAAILRSDNSLQQKAQADAPFKGDGLEGKGVYVARIPFDIAGNWMAVITAQRPNGQHAVIRLPFSVVAHSIVPDVGQSAPASANPTIKQVPDISYIDSGNPPDDMHQISIADAIAQHRPALVVFASPALCVSQICGPEVHAVQTLEPAYKNRLAFIHVEPYQLKPQPSIQVLTPTMAQWRLQTEPWVFLIDAHGIIRARFEGPTGADEIKAAIDHMLA